MKIGTTPDPRVDIAKEMRSISGLGFDFVELHIGDWIEDRKGEILNETRDLGLGLTGHLPDIDLCNPNPEKNRELFQRFSKGIDVFRELEIARARDIPSF